MEKGFTLIELLVVVLIIGILTAVAVPQYQKAVMRAECVETLALMREIYRARQLYLLGGGSQSDQNISNYPDLQLPAGVTLSPACSQNGCSVLRGNKQLLNGHTAHMHRTIKKGKYSIDLKLIVHYQGVGDPSKIKCSATYGDDASKGVCALLSGGKEPTGCSFVTGDCWLIDIG